MGLFFVRGEDRDRAVIAITPGRGGGNNGKLTEGGGREEGRIEQFYEKVVAGWLAAPGPVAVGNANGIDILM